MKYILAFLLASPILFGSAQQKVVVYFPFNKYYITMATAAILDSAIKANAGKHIDSVKIYGYCDAIGSYGVNDTLGIQRANAVKDFLLQHKLGVNNFKELTGFGKRAPVNNNSTEKLRALNRRAEIFIYTSTGISVATGSNMYTVFQSGKVGDKVRLYNLNFYAGHHELIPVSVPVVDTLVALLKAHPTVEIEIQGYICCDVPGADGMDQGNGKYGLSVYRAKFIYDYLVKSGIDARRLSYHGFGSQPLVREWTEHDRATNRRVEIKIVKR